MKRSAPYIISVLLVTEMAALHFFGNVVLVDTPGVLTELPDRIGSYHAIDYVYCQAEQCLSSIRVANGEESPRSCPSCNGIVADVTLAEKTLLPAGTQIIKRSYETPQRPSVHVSIVLATQERRSIHKPQICLRGQGYAILNQRVEQLNTAGSHRFEAMFLDTTRTQDRRKLSTSYAYWFTSKTRETPHHLTRLFWMAIDGAIFGQRYTWAYIAVSSTSTSQKDAKKTVQTFLMSLYPAIHPTTPSRDKKDS